jgi:uncharacterized protein
VQNARPLAFLRRCRKGAALLFDLPTFFRVLRTLNSNESRHLARRDPMFVFKYLGDYLARSFTRDQRARALVNHYAFLNDNLVGGFLGRLSDAPMMLWQQEVTGVAYRIYLEVPTSCHAEGDLALVFRADETNIFFLSFTIAPGRIAGLAAPHVMYIARIQGKGGALDLIKNVTRNCHDVSPAATLLSAAQAVALALRIKDVIGISADDQLAVGGSSPSVLCPAVYDDFWRAMGASSISHQMFHLPVPLPEKPLSLISSNHRSRTVRKRNFKHEVSAHVEMVFRAQALKASVRDRWTAQMTNLAALAVTLISSIGVCVADIDTDDEGMLPGTKSPMRARSTLYCVSTRTRRTRQLASL